jgi:integrase
VTFGFLDREPDFRNLNNRRRSVRTRVPVGPRGLGSASSRATSNRVRLELHVSDMPTPLHPRRRAEGVVVRHSSRCATHRDGNCDCRPGYQAQVFSRRDQKTIRKTFETLADARAWRAETHSALRLGTLRAPTRTTVDAAAFEWLTAARAQVVRTRSGTPYKPSALRAYEEALRTKVMPELGHLRLSAVSRAAVQDLVDRLVASGRSPSTVRNAILPLRAIYRRALARSEVLVNPTLGLSLPAPRGSRDRIAHPAEAKALLDALTPEDRPVWATALYAGLRRGEIRGLRWGDLDFDPGLIRVEQSWDETSRSHADRAGCRRLEGTAPYSLRADPAFAQSESPAGCRRPQV